MDFKTLIKKRRQALNMTLDDIARMVGVSKGTVQRWESGAIANIRRDKISHLAKALQTTPAALMGWDEDINPCYLSHPELQQMPAKLVPHLSCQESDQPTYIQISTNREADFCFRFHGDSMIGARIQDGDIILGINQKYVENGQLAVILLQKNPTLRRVYTIGDTIWLHAENPAYEPIAWDGLDKSINIIGRAIAFQSLIK
jgi:repressor LexA